MNVYIPTGNITDMQGPCPSGFHVPTNDEWTSIKEAGISLGAWSSTGGNSFSSYLKMPLAGYRYVNSTDGQVTGQAGTYWSCTGDSDDILAYRFFFYSGGFVQGSRSKSEGLSIRGIANTPIIPDSSWTRTYTGTGDAGIYYNSDLGLISISSDGTTWYTLMDKNIGATTVFNYGDTLTVANTGNLFQWGNNYGFPGTLSSDTITTSPTQVDASSYGPGNYYSSSTWITANIGCWDSSKNQNLRGGVTGPFKINELKNAYIGEVYEYSYDFRGKSSSEIGNEFTRLVGTIASNSNGFYGSGGGCIIGKNIPGLSNASRITISGIVVGTNSSSTATQIGIGKGTSWGNGNASYSLYGSQYNGCKVCYYDGTDHNGNVVGNATGITYNVTLIIDLVQKTITGIVPGFSNSTLSLTDVQINNIRTFEYLRCYVSSSNSTLSYINILVE